MSTLGYIVTCEDVPLVESNGYGDGGPAPILSIGNYQTATVFPARRAAERAIHRTVQYAEIRGLPWSTDYKIIRLEPRR